jgi:hypothetical protein
MLAITLAVLAAAGCSQEDPEHVRLPELTTFTGVGVELTGGGWIEINIGTDVRAQAADDVLGTPPALRLGPPLDPAGVELWVSVGRYDPARFSFIVNLTGTFHTGTRVLDLSGTGHRFVGTIEGDRISGQFFGPLKDGGFVALRGTPFEHEVYCGEIEDAFAGAQGTINLLRTGNALQGFAIRFDQVLLPLSGSIDGSDVALAPTDGGEMVLTGTFVNSQIQGTFTVGTQDEGRWHVARCN